MSDRHDAGLLDTCVLISLPQIPAEALPTASSISAVSLAELCAGLHSTKDPSERARRMARVQSIEASTAPLPFDTEAARQYGVLVALTLAYGRSPRPCKADLMIAATAVAHALPLFTANPADFEGLESALQVVPVPVAAA